MKAAFLEVFGVSLAVILFGCIAYFLFIRPNVDSPGDGKADELLRDGTAQISVEPGLIAKDADRDEIVSSTLPSDVADTSAVARTTALSVENRTNKKNQSVAGERKIAQENNTVPARADSSDAPEPDATVQQPIAFAEDSPNPSSSAEEIEEIKALRQEFIEEIGGYDQNVSDPEYYRRWGEAQQLLDEEVRTQLGEEAFNRLQNESVTHVATTATDE